MKTKTTKRKWLGAALLALLGLAAGRAQATSSTATLNIDVTITAAMSVNISGGVYAATETANWNGVLSSVTATSSVTVTNDSSIVTERWKLSTATYSWTTGGSTWTIVSSSSNLGADSVAVQAVFGSSNTVINGCTAVTSSGTWNSSTVAPPLTTTGAQYTSAGEFASPELAAGGGLTGPDTNASLGEMYTSNVTGYGARALCWRIVMPPTTSVTQTQVVPVIVTAY